MNHMALQGHAPANARKFTGFLQIDSIVKLIISITIEHLDIYFDKKNQF